MFKKYSIFIFALIVIFTLSACSKKTEEELVEEEKSSFKVSGQYLNEYSSFKQELTYSGIVFPLAEANIVAKVSGTLIDSQVNLGDMVSVGERLARIDDLTLSSNQDNFFNANQIKQAEIAVSQAKNSYDLALDNYNNILSSSAKELKQTEIALEQSLKNKDNLELTINESLASAEIAYETAELSAEQAKLNLDNQTSQFNQARENLKENSILSINSSLNTASSLLTGINNITSFDSNNSVNIEYKNNLGALDSSSLIKSKNLYNQAKNQNEKIADINTDLQVLANLKNYSNEVIIFAEIVKELADSTKVLFNKTITSSSLSQAQLTTLQNQVASFQSQASNALSQAKGVKQSLNNFELEYKNTLELLEKSYSLALKQKETAEQNLNNLKAGNISQSDQAFFNAQLATNQLDNVEIKLKSQIESAQAQVNSAKMQYDNALLSLENLYDSYTLLSPLSGVVSSKQFDNGDTISAGQLVYTISQTNGLKVVFFIEQSQINFLELGQEIIINNSVSAIISSLSPQADSFSKKFKVEALLPDNQLFKPQTVVDISITLNRRSFEEDIYFIPLSSLNINQSGSFIYIVSDNKAKEKEVEILEVIGERAKIRVEDGAESIIIIDGNRRLQAGQLIEIDI
jgi:multidrug efflux pump subunit AcrA (membrane-fusion protein)